MIMKAILQKKNDGGIRSREGFTLMELLIVLVISIALGLFMFADYSGKQGTTAMSTATQEIAATLQQAQSKALAGEGSGASTNGFWAVEFANPATSPAYFGLLFETSTANLASGTATGNFTRLPEGIAFTTSTVASNGTLFIYYANGNIPSGMPQGAYQSCTGFTCASTSTIMVGLYTPNEQPALSSTVTVAATGAVSY